jgi:hypothetical protein
MAGIHVTLQKMSPSGLGHRPSKLLIDRDEVPVHDDFHGTFSRSANARLFGGRSDREKRRAIG